MKNNAAYLALIWGPSFAMLLGLGVGSYIGRIAFDLGLIQHRVVQFFMSIILIVIPLSAGYLLPIKLRQGPVTKFNWLMLLTFNVSTSWGFVSFLLVRE